MAWDWIVNLTLIKHGNFNRIKKGYLYSSFGGTSTKKNYIYNSDYNFFERLFPFYKFSKVYLSFIFKENNNFKIVYKLLIILLNIHLRFIKRFIKSFYDK